MSRGRGEVPKHVGQRARERLRHWKRQRDALELAVAGLERLERTDYGWKST